MFINLNSGICVNSHAIACVSPKRILLTSGEVLDVSETDYHALIDALENAQRHCAIRRGWNEL